MPDKESDYGRMPRLTPRGGGGGARRRFAPTEKPKNAKKTLLRLFRIFLKWRGALAVSMVLTLFSASVSLLTPLLIGKGINAFRMAAGTVNRPLLTTVLTALAACYLAGWAIDTVNGLLMSRVTQQLVREIRTEMFSKLQKIPLNFYDTHPHGDVMSRITNDVDNISDTVGQTTTQLISSVFSVVGSFVMMLSLNPLLTLVAVISIPLFLILTKFIAGRSRRYFLGQQRMLGDLNGMVEETVSGLDLVRAFNLQGRVLGEFREVNDRLRDDSMKAQIWSGFLMPFMNVINNLSFALIATVGGVLSVNGGATVGTVVSVLTYSRQFGRPLNGIAGMFNNIQSALAGAERIFEILDEDEESPSRPGAVDLRRPAGEVKFRNVSFSYLSGKPVLKGISFRVHPGEVVALVGETGAGKTTIVNLLTRFYERDEGEIRIDGIDLTDISRESLHSCFSVVLQDTCLFTGTIADNIRYSRPGATDAAVAAAAKTACADDFIARLPRGYHTMVTGSSDNLSQGQRQLIAIARAILCDAPILILDEATSSVDTRTEKKIQKALLALMKGHTSFLIAHRLSTVRDADRILVLSGGKIEESGTHEELMRVRGQYYRMVVSQTGEFASYPSEKP